MKIENQVVSLELAKQMKEAGFPQDSLWCWRVQKKWKTKQISLTSSRERTDKTFFAYYSSYTVAELGEILPECFSIKKRKDFWECNHIRATEDEGDLIDIEVADTEADARAKMALYLKKEGLLEVKP